MSCQPCQTIACDVPNDLETYSLQTWINFLSPTLSFIIQCPVGYVCQAGSFPRTIRYPPGRFVIVYPPNPAGGFIMRLQGCISEVTRTVPSGSTAAQLAALAAEIVNEVAQQQAQCDAVLQPPVPQPEPEETFLNEEVYYVVDCEEGEDLTFTGTFPSWISLDEANSRIVGAAGTLPGATQAEANALAQTALNAFGDAAVAAGELVCEGCPLDDLVWSVESTGTGGDGVISSSSFVGLNMSVVLSCGSGGANFANLTMDATIPYDGAGYTIRISGTVTTFSGGGNNIAFDFWQDFPGGTNFAPTFNVTGAGAFSQDVVVPPAMVTTAIIIGVFTGVSGSSPTSAKVRNWSGSLECL